MENEISVETIDSMKGAIRMQANTLLNGLSNEDIARLAPDEQAGLGYTLSEEEKIAVQGVLTKVDNVSTLQGIDELQQALNEIYDRHPHDEGNIH